MKKSSPWLAVHEGATIESKQTYRKKGLSEFCRHGHHKTDTTFKGHLVVDNMNKIVYCLVPKAGSTEWLKTLREINIKALNLPVRNDDPHHVDKMAR